MVNKASPKVENWLIYYNWLTYSWETCLVLEIKPYTKVSPCANHLLLPSKFFYSDPIQDSTFRGLHLLYCTYTLLPDISISLPKTFAKSFQKISTAFSEEMFFDRELSKQTYWHKLLKVQDSKPHSFLS